MEPLSAESAARHLYRFAIESRDYAVLTLDLGGRITWWGPGAEAVLGFKAAEMVGEPLARIFTPEDIIRGADRQEREIAVEVGSAEDDRWQVRRDGSRIFASGVLTALHDERGEACGFVKILRDRTDLREQLERLRNQLAEAQGAAARKDVFLATLSHELRNPLAPLVTASGLIRMTAPSSPEVDHALKVIDRQAALLKRLVDDLLDLTRVGTGKVQLVPLPVDLGELLSQAVAAARARPDCPSVELLLPGTPIRVRGDADRLQQVFGNLLGNACKFTPATGHVWVKGTVEADEAVVRVEDDGIGIARDMLPRIFELFTQAEETRGLSAGGLGIGLALVKDLVELHGGTVQVRSEGYQRGAEFTVRLPLLREAGAPAEPPGPAAR